MTPEAAESLMNSQSPEKASTEKPVHVKGHPPHRRYPNNPTAKTPHEMSKATTAPTIPKSNTNTKSQPINTLTSKAAKETHVITKILSWDCKNRCNGNWNAKMRCRGVSHKATTPDISATSSGSLKSFRIGVAKRYKGKSKILQRKSTIHDLCRYMPSIWYLFAPKAWPHSVSNALAIPN